MRGVLAIMKIAAPRNQIRLTNRVMKICRPMRAWCLLYFITRSCCLRSLLSASPSLGQVLLRGKTLSSWLFFCYLALFGDTEASFHENRLRAVPGLLLAAVFERFGPERRSCASICERPEHAGGGVQWPDHRLYPASG